MRTKPAGSLRLCTGEVTACQEQRAMTPTLRVARVAAAVIFAFAAPQATLAAQRLAVTAGHPVEPRFESAWTSLNSALWMLTHSDAVRAEDPSYKREIQLVYAAIGALDDGIMSSMRKAGAPKDVAGGKARLHAALDFLHAAGRGLASPSRDPSIDRPRASALNNTREAIEVLKSLIEKCRC